jgi:hypothetical protein
VPDRTVPSRKPKRPPRKAPNGLFAGRGAASAMRRAEVWNVRAALELPDSSSLEAPSMFVVTRELYFSVSKKSKIAVS